MSDIKRQAAAVLPTDWGDFEMIAFADQASNWMPHLALVHQKTNLSQPVPVRIHSECITGDLFGSHRCDCGDQLTAAMKLIQRQGGVLLYLRQEGRGIGIINKLKAYNLQDSGMNTIDANVHMGLEPDARHYDEAIQMLTELGIKQVKLITNNPEKLHAIEESGIELVERIPLVIPPKEANEDYLRTKAEAMGHMFKLY